MKKIKVFQSAAGFVVMGINGACQLFTTITEVAQHVSRKEFDKINVVINPRVFE